MFSLMDKVPNGIEPMLKDLEEHIISAGLADMVASAETITTVCERAHVFTHSSSLNQLERKGFTKVFLSLRIKILICRCFSKCVFFTIPNTSKSSNRDV